MTRTAPHRLLVLRQLSHARQRLDLPDSTFTAEELRYLRSLPAVVAVSAGRIRYTEAFKRVCMRQYRQGKSPARIFREAGLDSALIGYKRIERCIARWRNIGTEETPEQLAEDEAYERDLDRWRQAQTHMRAGAGVGGRRAAASVPPVAPGAHATSGVSSVSGVPASPAASAISASPSTRMVSAATTSAMGTISIPSIGVHLPIRHGTSSDVLSAGAGYLMGTSLPVGGSSTHAVITAHRGLAGASMFTRLDEMAVGDRFSLTVLGATMTYRVDRVTVIKPEDTAILRISSTEDRVTLMTCTPYGVNTHRLLVSGVRVPNATAEAGRGRTSHAGPTTRVWCWIALAAGGLVIGGGIGYLVWRGRRKSGS